MPKHRTWAGPQFDGHVCSLGYYAVDWIQEFTCFGVGDLAGQPSVVDDEIANFIINAYRIDPVTGTRVYDEAVLSRPKGRAKSEVAAWLSLFEAYGECRFDGWDADGQPVARRVSSPDVLLLATSEDQTGNTYDNVTYCALLWGQETHPEIYGGTVGGRDYRTAGFISPATGGVIKAGSTGADSKDGGKQTFVVADETHLATSRQIKNMYATLIRNLSKRPIAQPWMLQTSTVHRVGEASIFEQTYDAWRAGRLSPRTLMDHREAQGPVDVLDKERTLEQLRYVYGDATWVNYDGIYHKMLDPRTCRDEAEAARFYLNRALVSDDMWMDMSKYDAHALPDEQLHDGDAVALGFDGSLNDDSTVISLSRMSDGHLFRVGVWEKPLGAAGSRWQVPRLEVLSVIRSLMQRYHVTRAYMDPHEWRSDIEQLAQSYDQVVPFPTSQYARMADALDRLRVNLVTDAIPAGVTHDGSDVARKHYGNAYRDDRGRYQLVRKEYPNSPRKIDFVVSDALALAARTDAVADGWTPGRASNVIFLRRSS